MWRMVTLALVLRFLFVVVFLSTTKDTNYTPVSGESYSLSGSDGIVQVGYNWITNGSYSLIPDGPEIAFRPPLPVFLSGICTLVTPDYWYVVYIAINCLLGALLIKVCSRIFRVLAIPSKIYENLALLAIAIHPYMVFSAKTLTAINLLAFLMALSTLFLLKALRGDSRSGLYLGLTLGAGALSHGSFMLLPFFCGFILLVGGYFQKSLPRALKSVAVMIVVAMLAIAPWSARNYDKFRIFIPTASGAGLQFWITEDVVAGSFNSTTNSYIKIAADYEKKTGNPMTIQHGGVIDPRQDAELAKWGKQLLLANPGHFFKRAGFGSLGFWAPLDQGFHKALIVGLVNLPLVIATILLAGFAVHSWAYNWNATALLGVCMYIWGIFAAIQAISSYFVMITPLVIIHGTYLLFLIQHSKVRHSGIHPAVPL